MCVGIACPPSFCLQPHEDNPAHGDVCRKCSNLATGGSGPWTCPHGCVRSKGAQAPYCVKDQISSSPCRVGTGKQRKPDTRLKREAIEAAAAARASEAAAAEAAAEAALRAGIDECTPVLATVRSGEYLRLAPCAPKRGFYDRQLVGCCWFLGWCVPVCACLGVIVHLTPFCANTRSQQQQVPPSDEALSARALGVKKVGAACTPRLHYGLSPLYIGVTLPSSLM